MSDEMKCFFLSKNLPVGTIIIAWKSIDLAWHLVAGVWAEEFPISHTSNKKTAGWFLSRSLRVFDVVPPVSGSWEQIRISETFTALISNKLNPTFVLRVNKHSYQVSISVVILTTVILSVILQRHMGENEQRESWKDPQKGMRSGCNFATFI